MSMVASDPMPVLPLAYCKGIFVYDNGSSITTSCGLSTRPPLA